MSNKQKKNHLEHLELYALYTVSFNKYRESIKYIDPCHKTLGSLWDNIIDDDLLSYEQFIERLKEIKHIR